MGPEKFAETMGALGISDDTLVIAYDSFSSLYAARFWWALNYYGPWMSAEGQATATEPAVVPTAAATPPMVSAAPCVLTARGNANLRTGPGTTFARAGALAAGASQSVIGQTNGGDGFVWWKLESGSWVRSDLVQTGGDCTAVPTAAS